MIRSKCYHSVLQYDAQRNITIHCYVITDNTCIAARIEYQHTVSKITSKVEA